MTFIKFIFKRLALIVYSIAIFAGVLPLIGLLPMTITILAIPVVYFYYIPPAAAAGAIIGILLAFADRWFKPGKALTIWVGSIASPICAYFYFRYIFNDPNMFALPNFSSSSGKEHSLFATATIFMYSFMLALAIAGGTASSALIRGRLVDELLEK